MSSALLSSLPGNAPSDKDGYIVSFSVDEMSDARRFLDTYGFVVIRNALSEERVQATTAAFFSKFDASDSKAVDEFFENQRFGRLGIVV